MKLLLGVRDLTLTLEPLGVGVDWGDSTFLLAAGGGLGAAQKC